MVIRISGTYLTGTFAPLKEGTLVLQFEPRSGIPRLFGLLAHDVVAIALEDEDGRTVHAPDDKPVQFAPHAA